MDHGLTSFPVRGLQNIEEAIDDCIEGGVDAIVLQKGVLSHQINRLSWPNFIMHVSASTIHAGSIQTLRYQSGIPERHGKEAQSQYPAKLTWGPIMKAVSQDAGLLTLRSTIS